MAASFDTLIHVSATFNYEWKIIWSPTLGETGQLSNTYLDANWQKWRPPEYSTAHTLEPSEFSQLYATQQNPSVHSYSSTPTIVQPKPKYLIPHPQFPVERWSSGEITPDIQLLDVENNMQKGTISVHHSDQ